MTAAVAGLRSLVELAAVRRWESREPGEMDLAELHVCRTPDGGDWVLGQGTFGTVRVPLAPATAESFREWPGGSWSWQLRVRRARSVVMLLVQPAQCACWYSTMDESQLCTLNRAEGRRASAANRTIDDGTPT